MSIKLVVADIDMTLDSMMHPFSDMNRKAVEDLHSKGIYFGLASGRSIQQLKEKAKEFKLSFEPELLVGINGQTYYDGINNEERSLFALDKSWVKEICKVLDSYGYEYHAYIDNYTLFRKDNIHFKAIIKKVYRDVRLASSADDFLLGDNFYKFLFMFPNSIGYSKFEKRMKPLLDKHQNDFKIVKTTASSYEIVHAKASKAYGLKLFCDNHNINLKDVAAFGDADNDNEMIEAVGMGVCLKNGEKSTKEIADYITDKPYDKNGFGDFVYKHILNE